MKIVVDTSVFVSACIGRGAASDVIEACLRDRLTPVIGRSLYLEYEDVLDRRGIFRRARLTAAEEMAFSISFLANAS